MKLFVSFVLSCLISPLAFADAAPQGLDGHLSFERGALHAHLQWATPPKANQEAVLDVQWMNGATHTPAEPDGAFTAVLWMPSMGHGSSPVTIQRRADAQGRPVPGAFRISRMFFLMQGPWEIRFTLTHTDGGKETQAWPVSVNALVEGWGEL